MRILSKNYEILDENVMILVARNSSSSRKLALVKSTEKYRFLQGFCTFSLIDADSICLENNKKMLAEAHRIAI